MRPYEVKVRYMEQSNKLEAKRAVFSLEEYYLFLLKYRKEEAAMSIRYGISMEYRVSEANNRFLFYYYPKKLFMETYDGLGNPDYETGDVVSEWISENSERMSRLEKLSFTSATNIWEIPFAEEIILRMADQYPRAIA